MNTKSKFRFVCQYIIDKTIRDVPLPYWTYIDVNRVSLSLKINHTKVKILRGTTDIQIRINYLGVYNFYDLPNTYSDAQKYQIDTYYHIIKKGQSVLTFLLDDDHL